MFQRFLKWILKNILADIEAARLLTDEGLRKELTRMDNSVRGDVDSLQDLIKTNRRESQKLNQELNYGIIQRIDTVVECHRKSEEQVSVDIVNLRADSQTEVSRLRIESNDAISALYLRTLKIDNDLSETNIHFSRISAEFTELRTSVTTDIKSLLNTVSYFDETVTATASSISVIEDSWEKVQQALLDRFTGMEAALKQTLIKMSWDIDKIEKEPTQLRIDLTGMCDRAISQNRDRILKELQQIGQFSSLVYRKLLELDGSAPASLYGRIKLPLTQGDPVIQEPPTTETIDGTSLETRVDGMHRRLSVIETWLSAPLMSGSISEEPKVKGNFVSWYPHPAHFGNIIGE